MSASQIESFGLRRSAAVGAALYAVLFVAAIGYMALSVSIDATLLAAAAFVVIVSTPACYVLLVRQWRALGIEPAGGS